MKYLLWLIRIVVGVLFIFSGLVKANDPMGLVYKMKEFLEVLHMDFLSGMAFGLSIFMIALEIVCGVAVLLGAAFRFFSVILLLLNLFFLFLTGYALFTGTVKECGCFGACIKISNDATFYKDIVLTILALILFLYRRRVQPLFSHYPNTALMILATVFSFGIQWWVLEHLPFVDCLAYKPGNNLWQKMQLPPGATPAQYETIMIYQKDGMKKEFTMQNYPWQDSTWVFVDRKDKLIKEGTGEPEIKDFVLTDTAGVDQTQMVLTAHGYTFLWFVKDPAKARTDNMDRIKNIIAESKKQNIPFYVLSSGTKAETAEFQQKMQLGDVPVYTLDGTVSKTAMRTNPGLMLIKDSVVQHKWSFRDYPGSIALSNGQLNK